MGIRQSNEMSKVSSRNSLGMSIGNNSTGSMKIGGLARRKHAKKAAQLNAEIKAQNYQDPASPRIRVSEDKIFNFDNNLIINNT